MNFIKRLNKNSKIKKRKKKILIIILKNKIQQILIMNKKINKYKSMILNNIMKV